MPELRFQSAFSFPIPACVADGLFVRERPGLGAAMLVAVSGESEQLVRAVYGAFGVVLPCGPRMVSGARADFVGLGPKRWLAMPNAQAADWRTDLQEVVRGAGYVVDQSGGLAVLSLSGPAARKLLQKGVFIDLEPDAFPLGASASSVIDHIPVTFWNGPGVDDFQVCVPRSYADAFGHWLSRAASALP